MSVDARIHTALASLHTFRTWRNMRYLYILYVFKKYKDNDKRKIHMTKACINYHKFTSPTSSHPSYCSTWAHWIAHSTQSVNQRAESPKFPAMKDHEPVNYWSDTHQTLPDPWCATIPSHSQIECFWTMTFWTPTCSTCRLSGCKLSFLAEQVGITTTTSSLTKLDGCKTGTAQRHLLWIIDIYEGVPGVASSEEMCYSKIYFWM